MAALVCLGCGAVYSVGAPACPQCGADESRGDWEEVPPAVEVRGEHGPELALPPAQKSAPSATTTSDGASAGSTTPSKEMA